MNDLYQKTYRISSTRINCWNYGWAGTYYITICTYNKKCFFGYVDQGTMIKSDIGILVEKSWIQTKEIRKDLNLTLGAYIIMPNHMHMIISINDNKYNENSHIYNENQMPILNQFGKQSQNLSSVIRGFKSSVTKTVKINYPEFRWQPRFYDHIIRTEKSYFKITDYINRNPEKWFFDRWYKSNS